MVLLTIGANDVNFAGARRQRHRRRRPPSGCCSSRAAPSPASRMPNKASTKICRANFAVCARRSSLMSAAISRASFSSPTAIRPCRRRTSPAPAAATASMSIRLLAPTPSGCARRPQFVDTKFLPKLKVLATCDGSKVCRDPMTERMTFVDGHQAAFDRHGMCVRAADDPEFDRNCFSPSGESFPNRSGRGRRRSDGLLRCAPATTAPMRRARAGSGPPMTAISPP